MIDSSLTIYLLYVFNHMFSINWCFTDTDTWPVNDVRIVWRLSSLAPTAALFSRPDQCRSTARFWAKPFTVRPADNLLIIKFSDPVATYRWTPTSPQTPNGGRGNISTAAEGIVGLFVSAQWADGCVHNSDTEECKVWWLVLANTKLLRVQPTPMYSNQAV